MITVRIFLLLNLSCIRGRGGKENQKIIRFRPLPKSKRMGQAISKKKKGRGLSILETSSLIFLLSIFSLEPIDFYVGNDYGDATILAKTASNGTYIHVYFFGFFGKSQNASIIPVSYSRYAERRKKKRKKLTFSPLPSPSLPGCEGVRWGGFFFQATGEVSPITLRIRPVLRSAKPEPIDISVLGDGFDKDDS